MPTNTLFSLSNLTSPRWDARWIGSHRGIPAPVDFSCGAIFAQFKYVTPSGMSKSARTVPTLPSELASACNRAPPFLIVTLTRSSTEFTNCSGNACEMMVIVLSNKVSPIEQPQRFLKTGMDRNRRHLLRGQLFQPLQQLSPANPKELGYQVMAFVRIRPLPGHLSKIAELAQSVPEVTECHRITGEDCFILKVYVKEISNLDRVLDRFLAHGQTTTSIVQSSPVPPRNLPLAEKD
jgi:hypothetical protein